MKTRIALLLLSLLSTAVFAQPLVPFEAIFTAANERYTAGKVTMALSREGEYWRFTSTTKPSGLFSLFSGVVHESTLVDVRQKIIGHSTTLVTRHYTFQQKNGKAKRNLRADFKTSATHATVNTEAGTQFDVQNSTVIYDPLSSILQIMAVLAEQRFSATTLPIFSRDRVRQTRFSAPKSEPVRTGKTKYKAVKIVRKRDDGSRETHFWLASEQHFAPVKMEQYKRGELVVRLTLNSLRFPQ